MINSLSEWMRLHQASYKVAYNLGLQKEVAEKLGWESPNSVSKKREILELAKSGADRPINGKSKLGQAICSYISVRNKSHDPKFTKQIKELRPDWFSKSVEFNKQSLFDLAKSGGDKPSWKSKLGQSLMGYVNVSQHAYDSEFAKQIKELRPDWFPERKPLPKKSKTVKIEPDSKPE